WNFLFAWRAPRGPKVQEDDVTLECVQGDVFAINIFYCEVQVRDFPAAVAHIFRGFYFRRLACKQDERRCCSNHHAEDRSYHNLKNIMQLSFRSAISKCHCGDVVRLWSSGRKNSNLINHAGDNLFHGATNCPLENSRQTF